MTRSSGRSRRRGDTAFPPVAPAVDRLSCADVVLSVLERAFFSIISWIIRHLSNERKTKIIEGVLRFLIRYFLSSDRYNFWDRLFDHVKSHHNFHLTCSFSHVGSFNIPKVRQQGSLATCFIISCCGAVSSLVRRLKTIWVVLSVQQLIDNFNVTNTNGGLASDAYAFIEGNGIVEEEFYPFTGKKDTPKNPPKCRRFFIGGYKYLGRTSIEVHKDEFKRAPVTARMVFYESYSKYKKGIIGVPSNGVFCGMHSVLVTGFGVHKKTGREYFEVQSSHGYNWGFFGTAKVFAELLGDFQVPLSGGKKTIVDP